MLAVEVHNSQLQFMRVCATCDGSISVNINQPIKYIEYIYINKSIGASLVVSVLVFQYLLAVAVAEAEAVP